MKSLGGRRQATIKLEIQVRCARVRAVKPIGIKVLGGLRWRSFRV